MATATRDDLAADLRFLLVDKQVPEDCMDKLATLGFLTVSKFALIEDSRGTVRTMLKSEFGLDPAERADDRQKQASFIEAWETAVERAKREKEDDANLRSARLPRTMPKPDHLALQAAFQKAYFELSEDLTPSHTLVEFRLDMIEQGEIKGETLRAITSLADVQEGRLGATIDNAGVVRVRTGTQEVKMPADESALRRRLKIWGYSWIFAKLKQPGRLWLKDVEPQVIYTYTDYLFGEQVMGLEGKDPNGRVVSKPSFDLLLSYELQLRKKQAKLINEGHTFANALQDAMKDAETKTRYFTTPLAISSVHNAAADDSWGSGWGKQKWRSSDKDNAGWKKRKTGKDDWSKGQGKGGKGLANKTPDGRAICFRFGKSPDCPGNCGFVHCCRRCYGQHPWNKCPKNKGGEAATSSGAGDGDEAGR